LILIFFFVQILDFDFDFDFDFDLEKKINHQVILFVSFLVVVVVEVFHLQNQVKMDL